MHDTPDPAEALYSATTAVAGLLPALILSVWVAAFRPPLSAASTLAVFPRVLLFQERAGIPETLRIPSIGVEAPVEQTGVTEDGSMDVPTSWWNVGWYKRGPRPGEQGSAVIAGHYDSDTGPAVFTRLRELKAGDEIELIDTQGKTQHFRVLRSETFTDDHAPLEEIFDNDTPAYRLNLITCGGTWNAREGHYESRLVVFTEKINDGSYEFERGNLL